MRQFSYVILHPGDVETCIREYKKTAPDQCSGLLITIFTTHSDPSQMRELAGTLQEAFPSAVIAGSVTTDLIRNGSSRLDATVVGFNAFTTSQVRVEAFDCPETFSRDGSDFCARAAQLKDLVGIGILGTVQTADIQPFLNEMAALDKNIVIFGGGANTLQKEPAFVFTGDRIIKTGLAAILFSGPELHIHAGLKFGWKPLGREFLITKMTGDHIVEEIDHHPAAKIYEQYLGITPDSHFSQDSLAFPVFVNRGGQYIARHTTDVREDGALIFIADLHEGERLRLAYGDPGEMIADAREGFREMADFQPECMFILNCYAHRMFLQGDVKFELEPARDISPSHGYYTYGEIFRVGDTVGIHNMMLLSVGCREGEKAAGAIPAQSSLPPRFDESLMLVNRLVHFVSATTAELEIANKELDSMARLDRLTQLANRGEVESILKEAIDDAALTGQPLSALMLDLDDFKIINDTYGHDLGDTVLIEAAKILRGHVRAGDTVGRWGGEEFLLVLPKAPEKDAEGIAERIRAAIAEMNLLPDGRKITASFGVAGLAREESFIEFYRRLDHALYEAKASGKNCIITIRKKTQ